MPERGDAASGSSLELVGRFNGTVSRLVQREVELATAEARADIKSTVAVAK